MSSSPPPPSNTTSPTPPPTTTTPPSPTPPTTTPITPSPPPPSTPTPSPPPPSTPTPSPPPPSTPTPSPPLVPSPPPTTPTVTPTPSTPSQSPPLSPSPPPPSTTPTTPLSSPPPPSTTTPTTPSTPISRSPPPPTSSRTPLTPASRSPPPPPPSSSESSSTGIIVGVVIGGLVLVFVLTFFYCFCKKKRRRRNDEERYYIPPPPHSGPKDGRYGGQVQQWQHNAPPPSDHLMIAAGKPLPPTNTPPYMNSSGGSGSNYSGSEAHLPPLSPGMALGFSKSTFTYEELAIATNGFSEPNLLGQGGFGYVHKGVLPNGKEVAVKQLKVGSGQGEREFQAEVEIISRVHHRHLVSLVGYCISGAQRMLVYEFVSNNTLEFHLHGKGRPPMDWSSRLRVALGSARGLAYLHEDCHPKIIHRDIKAANILMDSKFEAKVADFGLARIASDTNTHVSTRVMGTFGYLAPEYAASGKLTEKSDVFSFGVVLLELITGRRPVNTTDAYMDDSLVDWARPLLNQAMEDGIFDSLADKRLNNDYNKSEMTRMVACAGACVRHSARRRPRMSQIVRSLEGEASLTDLNEGIRPGHSSVYSSYESSDYDTMQRNEDLKKFRKMALESQEYGISNEYSGPTSEFGLNPSTSSSESHTATREMETAKIKKFNGSS